MPKRPPIEPIQNHEHFAAAARILRQLETGLTRIERERAWLETEQYLERRPGDQRARAARDRQAKQRPTPPKTSEPPADEVSAAVAAALELLRDGARPARRDRRALIEQLANDHDVVREAIFEQQRVVDELRDQLSAELAQRLKAPHRELVLAQYRAAQALASATDAERAFRRAVAEGGFTWRADTLPAPSLRSVLILGSEGDWDSEVSRVRRTLEELKVLP